LFFWMLFWWWRRTKEFFNWLIIFLTTELFHENADENEQFFNFLTTFHNQFKLCLRMKFVEDIWQKTFLDWEKAVIDRAKSSSKSEANIVLHSNFPIISEWKYVNCISIEIDKLFNCHWSIFFIFWCYFHRWDSNMKKDMIWVFQDHYRQFEYFSNNFQKNFKIDISLVLNWSQYWNSIPFTRKINILLKNQI
jgi:hypothetical protein